MSVALTVVVRTGDDRSPASVLASLLDAVERMPECSGTWKNLSLDGPSRGRRPVRDPRDVMSSDELRALIPRLDGPEVRIAVSTGLMCWRFPGEPEPERLPMPLRLGARGPGFRGWGDERGEGVAQLVLDPVWPFRTPGGSVDPRDVAQYDDNRALLVRLVEAVVTTCAPVSVRVHSDVSAPLPFDAHLLYYRDPAAALADLAWIAELWEHGEPSRRIPALRDVPDDQLWRELHEWRARSTLPAVRTRLGRTVSVLEDVGPAQVEAVLVAGSCPARRLGDGFVVMGGQAFVDGFVDPFFTELADLVDIAVDAGDGQGRPGASVSPTEPARQESQPPAPQSVPVPPPDLPAFDVRVFFAGLLASPCAEQRAQGLAAWAEYGGATEDVLPLLEDAAPLVRERAGRSYVVEVRALALVALQERCRGQGSGWLFGPVRVRRAMPGPDAEAQAAALLADLAPPARAEAEAEADRVLRERVGPLPEHRPACRAYVLLQGSGRITHEVQEVIDGSLLTPLQQEILDGQLRSPRPVPHVRFADPTGRPVGYLYAALRRLTLDLDESEHAAQVRAYLASGVRQGSLPPWEEIGPNLRDRLRGVAAYAAEALHAELVTSAPVTVRVESWRRERADEECGELTFLASGRRLTAEMRQWYETDWEVLASGRLIDAELWLSRWFDDGRLVRADGPAPGPAGRTVVEDGVLYRIDAPVAGVLRHEHDGRREVVLHLDLGLDVPVLLDGVLPEETDGLTIGDRVCLRAVLNVAPLST
ncbi:MAG: hypothetical protein JNL54_11855 [Kineosporiaceae bacterium]|nr:hypothetical protein [Kineosporiaceae bacterium]